MSGSAPAEPACATGGGRAAGLVIAAGVCAALHVGKLPPAITALQREVGLSLVEAGFLLSLLQFAGMGAGAAFGAVADALGLRRSMLIGLVALAAASVVGGFVRGAGALMALRAVEGFGFLLVALPAPGLLRRLVAPAQLSRTLGVWGAYMPLGTALALLLGPVAIDAFGWPAWWWSLGGLSAVMALALASGVPTDGPHRPVGHAAWAGRFRATLGSAGPWLVAITFAAYSSQWLAVIGFLPSIYLRAGISGAATGVLTALAAAVNIVGNVGAGRALHHGILPTKLLQAGFIAMGLAATLSYAGSAGNGAPPAVRYAAVLAFSAVGGMIPATLFTLAVRLAPGEATVSTSVGWVQQWSSFGQFAGPPAVAWLAARAGGWHWTWVATGACALLGIALARVIARRHRC